VSSRWIFGLALATLLFPLLDLPADRLAQGFLAGLSLTLAGTTVWLQHRAFFAVATAGRLRRFLYLYLMVLLLILLGGALL